MCLGWKACQSHHINSFKKINIFPFNLAYLISLHMFKDLHHIYFSQVLLYFIFYILLTKKSKKNIKKFGEFLLHSRILMDY
jgi:hypothetical protein